MATLLGALLQNESGGRNILQGNIGDINNRTGDLAKGYFQITDATWRDFGGLNTGYSRAIDAPYEVQAQVAGNIPLKRWGPNTISAMRATGRPIDLSMTLGQNLAAHGESFGTAPNVGGYSAPTGAPTTAAAAPTGATLDTVKPDYQPLAMGAESIPFQGPTNIARPFQGPTNTPTPFQGPVAAPASEQQIAGADKGKGGWREKLAKLQAGFKMPAIAKSDTALTGMAMPKAARVDSPEIAPFDANEGINQRQQLAMAMQKLNSGKLWL